MTLCRICDTPIGYDPQKNKTTCSQTCKDLLEKYHQRHSIEYARQVYQEQQRLIGIENRFIYGR